MNRITPKLNRASAVDFADFDIEEPERLFHEDRQFELAFTDGNQVKRINTIQFWFQRQCYCK
jgi:hypothetical protein